MNGDVYLHMWGPNEFTSTGLLKDFDRIDELKEITVPTLFICGEFDEARPETVQYYSSLVPNSKYAMIENAAHITMHDNPQADIKVINEFLNELN